MTARCDNGSISGNSMHIAYTNLNIAAIWIDHDGYYYIHRWEYSRGHAPKIFDVELCKNSVFDVCKVVGIDEL